jgi:hypothetical protein
MRLLRASVTVWTVEPIDRSPAEVYRPEVPRPDLIDRSGGIGIIDRRPGSAGIRSFDLGRILRSVAGFAIAAQCRSTVENPGASQR